MVAVGALAAGTASAAIQGTRGPTSSATALISVEIVAEAAETVEMTGSEETFALMCTGPEDTEGAVNHVVSPEICGQIDRFQSVSVIEQTSDTLTVTINPI